MQIKKKIETKDEIDDFQFKKSRPILYICVKEGEKQEKKYQIIISKIFNEVTLVN